MARVFSENVNSFNEIHVTNVIAEELPKLLAWLSPLEPRTRHQDIRDRRVKNVGKWLLETDQFRKWSDRTREDKSDDATLFCYSDPGAGKTYISSLVVDTLCDQAGGQGVAVACFYFDFAARNEQSAANVLGTLLKQVVGGLKDIPKEIIETFKKQATVIGGRGLLLPEMVKMLQDIASSQRMFICIDALDECVPDQRVKVLRSLSEIVESSPQTRIFLTGRAHVRDEVEKRFTERLATVLITPIRDDITTYLRARLDEDTTPEVMDDSLQTDIVEKISETVSEIFLLVSLNVDVILRETTIHRRRQKLSALTDGVGLDDAYDATLKRITAQGGEKAKLGMATLMWICHSERPLQVDELCNALAVEIGSADFNTNNVPLILTVLTCCQGLVTVDNGASTVRLIHLTLQDYLSARTDLFGKAHSIMAETCLTFLNLPKMKEIRYDSPPELRETPFLEYSSKYWGIHGKRDLSECAKSLALRLFDQYSNHISIPLLLWQPWEFKTSERPPLFTKLHCAFYFGIVELTAALMKDRDINHGDYLGNTPLIWAAKNGHEDAVKQLLECEDIDLNRLDHSGRSPLLWAASSGHEGVAELLLKRQDMNPNTPDHWGRTPLQWAAASGHAGVLGKLLERQDINPNKPDRVGQTPLVCCAALKHEGMIKLLVARKDFNPQMPDRVGRIPLIWATMFGYEELLKVLLEREDFDPNHPDRTGRTALSWAASTGRKVMVKLLLARADVKTKQPDQWGRTPLSYALSFQQVGAADLLREHARKAAAKQTSDQFGQLEGE